MEKIRITDLDVKVCSLHYDVKMGSLKLKTELRALQNDTWLPPDVEINSWNDRSKRRADENFDNLLMASGNDNDETWDGYYIGDVWKPARDRNRLRAYKRQQQQSGAGRVRYTSPVGSSSHSHHPPAVSQVVCDGPFCEYYKVTILHIKI